MLEGLTKDEVKARCAAGQSNNVTLPTSRSYWQIVRENLINFINVVYFTISVVLASLERFDDAILVVITILGGVIVSVIQELWAKHKLDRIALLTRPKATVVREGQTQDIDPSEIVLGDILLVRPGDQIVVDGEIVGEGQIDVDESLLTGESELIPKRIGQPIYSGSFCVNGSTKYEAQKVGVDSLAYQMAISARQFKRVYTPLQQEINLIIRILLLLACFLWMLLGINYLLRSSTLAESAQFVSVVAGLVPSGLYLAITLAYALGAVRILGQKALIQQANAVESLSHIDILCLDKTGTLTANRINLESIYPLSIPKSELIGLLGDYVASASVGNQTSEAIATKYSGEDLPITDEVPFSSERKWSALAFGGMHLAGNHQERSGVYILGAPEVLSKSISLDAEVEAYIQAQQLEGLRVLLFAYNQDQHSLHDGDNKPCLPPHLTPLGILTFSDELRDEAQETLYRFAAAGIKVKIISGDNPQTVVALAKQVGLEANLKAISGMTLAEMSEAEFIQATKENTVFGRITPDQKAKLVKSLRELGHYVAMIGDGVNDVLALKQANLAIAMESGSKAARGVADILLLEDSFSALPFAFLEGQRIRNGIQDVLKLFLIRIFCITLLILSAGLLVFDAFPMLLKHSTITTLLAVGFPTFMIPIWAKHGMLPRRSMARALLHFTLPATLTLTVVAIAVYLGYLLQAFLQVPPDANEYIVINSKFLEVPRSALVTILILCGLLLVPFLKPPTRFWVGGEPFSGDWRYSIVALGILGLYAVILTVQPLREFFELSLLQPSDYFLLSLIALGWCMSLRYIWRAKLLDRFLGVDLS